MDHQPCRFIVVPVLFVLLIVVLLFVYCYLLPCLEVNGVLQDTLKRGCEQRQVFQRQVMLTHEIS